MKRHEKALVTGGAGFIGSHVAEELLKRGLRVIVLDDLSGGFVENVPAGAEFVMGSILDVGLIQDLFKTRKFDYVFHLAAYAAEGLSHFIKHFNYQNNLIGSINLINASINHEVRAFVFTSSIAVYGRNQLPMREDMVPVPEDSYGIAKLAVEQELRVSYEMFGLNYVIFRPHNVFGERQNIGDMYRNVVGIFMNRILAGEPLTIFGDGTQTRAFSYIRDVAPVIAEAVFNERVCGKTFNVGADIPVSVKDLGSAVCKVMGVAPKFQFLPERNEVKHAFASHDLLLQYFPNAKPEHSLEEGLANMAEWVRKVGSRRGKLFSSIEVLKNMPLSWRKVTE